jgi:hypothetical protein
MFENVPEGMTIAAFRDHPVNRMIALVGHSGSRALPTKTEIDKLGLATHDRKSLLVTLNDIAAIADDPDRRGQIAWQEADRRAGELVGALPQEQKNPKWFTRPTEDLTELGPKELAALVPRNVSLGGRR